MANRFLHDTAFAIATALTERMNYKLVPAEREAFYRLAYETSKAAILRHDASRHREAERVQAAAASCELSRGALGLPDAQQVRHVDAGR